MQEIDITPADEQLLHEQTFDAVHPGAILHDFGVLLDFVAGRDLKTTGKYDLLPIEVIFDLDALLARPLGLERTMKRPQLRSHPYLQGLYLVLRASGLGRINHGGNHHQLRLDPDLHGQWDRLSPTERYFNLLEAWLRLGQREMIGERENRLDMALFDCLQCWAGVPPGGKRFDVKRPRDVFLSGIGRDYYQLALMDLFGLLAVVYPPKPPQPWCPAGVRHTAFGDALLRVFYKDWRDLLFRDLAGEEEDEQNPEEAGVPRLGVWQPLLQPYFPAWQNNLVYPEPDLREGVWFFKVWLSKSVWRRLAMPADATLADLADWVLEAFKFDDHLYEISYRDRFGRKVRAEHEAMEEGPWAHEIILGKLPLEPGQSMDMLYDFGDNWQFTIQLEKIEPKAKTKGPRIVEKHGRAPEQYPDVDGW